AAVRVHARWRGADRGSLCLARTGKVPRPIDLQPRLPCRTGCSAAHRRLLRRLEPHHRRGLPDPRPAHPARQVTGATAVPAAAQWAGRARRPGILRHFVRDRFAVGGLVLALLLVLSAVAAPVLTPYDPDQVDLSVATEPPSPAHVFG